MGKRLLLKRQLDPSKKKKKRKTIRIIPMLFTKKKRKKEKKGRIPSGASHKYSDAKVKEYLFWTKRKARLYFGHHNAYLDPTVCL